MTESTYNRGRGERLQDSYRTIKELDAWRNLSTAASVLLFVVSGAMSIFAFDLLSSLLVWPGMNEHLATSLVIISWVLIFPIWILSFLVLQTSLHCIGFRGLKGATKKELSKLNLGADELFEIRNALASKELRHASLFEDAITDLIRNPTTK